MRVFWEPEWRDFFFCMSKVRPEYHTNKQTCISEYAANQSRLYCIVLLAVMAWPHGSSLAPMAHTIPWNSPGEEKRPNQWVSLPKSGHASDPLLGYLLAFWLPTWRLAVRVASLPLPSSRTRRPAIRQHIRPSTPPQPPLPFALR
jgi:hypothetical protein